MTEREMLSCKEAIRLLASYLDDELEDESRRHLEHHLGVCRSCYSRHDFEKGLKEQISNLGQEAIRPEFEERIRSLVARFADVDGD